MGEGKHLVPIQLICCKCWIFLARKVAQKVKGHPKRSVSEGPEGSQTRPSQSTHFLYCLDLFGPKGGVTMAPQVAKRLRDRVPKRSVSEGPKRDHPNTCVFSILFGPFGANGQRYYGPQRGPKGEKDAQTELYKIGSQHRPSQYTSFGVLDGPFWANEQRYDGPKGGTRSEKDSQNEMYQRGHKIGPPNTLIFVLFGPFRATGGVTMAPKVAQKVKGCPKRNVSEGSQIVPPNTLNLFILFGPFWAKGRSYYGPFLLFLSARRQPLYLGGARRWPYCFCVARACRTTCGSSFGLVDQASAAEC